MSQIKLLLDTDTISLLRRGNPKVSQRVIDYIVRYGQLVFTELSWYEIIRGYRSIGAQKQLAVFEEFCRQCTILPLDRRALDTAANIYASLHKRGELIGEVDILIAGIAVANDMGIVTSNCNHFRRIDGLYIEDWKT